jgi:hypothetical protein
VAECEAIDLFVRPGLREPLVFKVLGPGGACNLSVPRFAVHRDAVSRLTAYLYLPHSGIPSDLDYEDELMQNILREYRLKMRHVVVNFHSLSTQSLELKHERRCCSNWVAAAFTN